jgi:hypothetical protein
VTAWRQACAFCGLAARSRFVCQQIVTTVQKADGDEVKSGGLHDGVSASVYERAAGLHHSDLPPAHDEKSWLQLPRF